ncbi:hypothetical protein C5S29_04330, partial [ANME-1 cluster archaeon GoMg3.2]|nr:hypothetical protein [ANME-1 cluster archaeon GoMg3.2]
MPKANTLKILLKIKLTDEFLLKV